MDLKNETATTRRLRRALAIAALATALTWPSVTPADECNPGETNCDVLPAATEESPGLARIADLAELRFNPLMGRFTVAISGARPTSDPEEVKVYVNDRVLPTTAVALSRSAIEVDYSFDSGLNEILVIVPDADGRLLRADGLFWAGDNTLIVDVTDDAMNPLDGVPVTVRLGQAGTVKATAVTEAGTVRFDHLPNATLVVEARHHGYTRVSAAAASGAGPVLLILTPDAAVATSRQ